MNKELPEILEEPKPNLETPAKSYWKTTQGWVATRFFLLLVIAAFICSLIGYWGFERDHQQVDYINLILIGFSFGSLWTLGFVFLWVKKMLTKIPPLRKVGMFLLLMAHLIFAVVTTLQVRQEGAFDLLEQHQTEKWGRDFPSGKVPYQPSHHRW
jgi:hypothetical protein